MNDDDQQRRDDLIRGLSMIDEIRAGRGAPADSELNASRLAILNGDAPPPRHPGRQGVIPIHPAVLEEFRARRAMRIALAESFRLLPEAERLEAEYLRAYGGPDADRLFAEWERAHVAAEANCALRDMLAARCKAADAAFDTLPAAVRWAWMDAAIPT